MTIKSLKEISKEEVIKNNKMIDENLIRDTEKLSKELEKNNVMVPNKCLFAINQPFESKKFYFDQKPKDH